VQQGDAEVEPSADETRRAHLSRVLRVVSLPIFAIMLDASVLYVAFPAIRAAYHSVSLANLSWILNGYTIVWGALLIPAGAYADRFGRKKLFLVGTLVFALGSALCGISPSVGFLIIGRIVQGIGAALLVPTSLAIILAEFPKEKRPVAIAAWGAAGALAAAIGPSLGALIIQLLGWRWAFYINLPIGAWCFIQGFKYITDVSVDSRMRLPSQAGVFFSIFSIVFISLAIVQSRDWAWMDVRMQGALGLGAIFFVSFVAENLRSRSPMIDPTLFQSRNFTCGNAATFLFSITFSAMFLSYVLFLKEIWHYSTVQTGLAMTVAPLLVIPSAILTGRYAAKRGHALPILIGCAIWVFGFAFRAVTVAAAPNFLVLWLPLAILGGIGGGMILPSLSSAATHDLPSSRYAVGAGVNGSIRQLGGVIGVAATVACLGVKTSQLQGAFATLFYALALVAVLTALFGARVRTRPAEPTEASFQRGDAPATDPAK
jgi:EmrB/QacA subfamily drug resistance transporter